jgi:hypothetical protein
MSPLKWVAFLFMLFPLPAHANPPIELEATWCAAVNADREPEQIYSDTVLKPPLVLWTKIRGGDAALKVLREEGKLPIRHKWFYFSPWRVKFDGSAIPTDVIDLGVGKKALLDKLQLELAERGFFDWRTWSRKQNLRSGAWLVKISYADGRPVMCDNKPCQYKIEVTQ